MLPILFISFSLCIYPPFIAKRVHDNMLVQWYMYTCACAIYISTVAKLLDNFYLNSYSGFVFYIHYIYYLYNLSNVQLIFRLLFILFITIL